MSKGLYTFAPKDVLRPITAPEARDNERWLAQQLDRIAPYRAEMGSAGDTQALTILVFQMKHANARLQGEAGVLRALLEEALNVISTLEPEDDEERKRLHDLQRQIVWALK